MRLVWPPLRWSRVLLLASLVGIGCGSDPNATGLRVQVNLNALSVDQLTFTVSYPGSPPPPIIDHVPRPMVAVGRLAAHQMIEIYLRDDLGGTVRVEVTGLLASRTVATSAVDQALVPHRLMPVTISLGVGPSSDGGVEPAPGDVDGAAEVSDAAADDVAGIGDVDDVDDVKDSRDTSVADDVRDAPVADDVRDTSVVVEVRDGPVVDDVRDVAGTAEVRDTAGLPLGSPCGLGDGCQSGLCVDRVCCSSTCGTCYACNVPRHEGTCAPAPFGTPGARCNNQNIPCGFDGTCDGYGGCYMPPAGLMCMPGSCNGPSLTPAGACDGRGNCLRPSLVDCAPFVCDPAGGPHCRTDCGGPADCVATAACTNRSCGLRPKKSPGDGCAADVDCMSGFCTDGVCCGARCQQACVSCNQPGQLGSCRPVPAMQPDPRNLCKRTSVASCGTNGLCTAAGGCQLYAAGTVCEPARCSTGGSTFSESVVIGAKKCDASGVCMATSTTSCFPFQCNPDTVACSTPGGQ